MRLYIPRCRLMTTIERDSRIRYIHYSRALQILRLSPALQTSKNEGVASPWTEFTEFSQTSHDGAYRLYLQLSICQWANNVRLCEGYMSSEIKTSFLICLISSSDLLHLLVKHHLLSSNYSTYQAVLYALYIWGGLINTFFFFLQSFYSQTSDIDRIHYKVLNAQLTLI